MFNTNRFRINSECLDEAERIFSRLTCDGDISIETRQVYENDTQIAVECRVSGEGTPIYGSIDGKSTLEASCSLHRLARDMSKILVDGEAFIIIVDCIGRDGVLRPKAILSTPAGNVLAIDIVGEAITQSGQVLRNKQYQTDFAPLNS